MHRSVRRLTLQTANECGRYARQKGVSGCKHIHGVEESRSAAMWHRIDFISVSAGRHTSTHAASST